MFRPAWNKIEVKPLSKDSVIIDDKQDLVELGEIISLGTEGGKDFYKIGDILAFEGWGCTKISYKGVDRWVVADDKSVILGKFTADHA